MERDKDGFFKIKSEDLVPGITFNEPLFDENGARIASPNTPITEDEISVLLKWNIQHVKTKGKITSGHKIIENRKQKEEQQNREIKAEKQNYGEISKSDKIKLLHMYDEWTILITEFLQDLSKGMSADRFKLDGLVTKMIENVPLNKNAFLSIAQSRETKEYIYGHALNVGILSIIIGDALEYKKPDLKLLATSALVCDIGMFKIPKHIREKNVALSSSDIKLIKSHPNLSYNILNKYGQFIDIIPKTVLQVHENYDGSGYPNALKADEISEFAKIISIADSFDAMTKKRSFRKEKVPHNIMKELLKGVEKRFDPKIMKVFLMSMAIYPVGSMVQLNTKELGIVVGTNKSEPLKPIIKLLYDSNYKKFSEDKVKRLDLTKSSDKKIIGVVNPKELGISIVNEL